VSNEKFRVCLKTLKPTFYRFHFNGIALIAVAVRDGRNSRFSRELIAFIELPQLTKPFQLKSA
jgi:hypothetical protein